MVTSWLFANNKRIIRWPLVLRKTYEEGIHILIANCNKALNEEYINGYRKGLADGMKLEVRRATKVLGQEDET